MGVVGFLSLVLGAWFIFVTTRKKDSKLFAGEKGQRNFAKWQKHKWFFRITSVLFCFVGVVFMLANPGNIEVAESGQKKTADDICYRIKRLSPKIDSVAYYPLNKTVEVYFKNRPMIGNWMDWNINANDFFDLAQKLFESNDRDSVALLGGHWFAVFTDQYGNQSRDEWARIDLRGDDGRKIIWKNVSAHSLSKHLFTMKALTRQSDEWLQKYFTEFP